eukprot:scaffold54714_cov59-Phaeocystis_antarctica.AAC.6
MWVRAAQLDAPGAWLDAHALERDRRVLQRAPAHAVLHHVHEEQPGGVLDTHRCGGDEDGGGGGGGGESGGGGDGAGGSGSGSNGGGGGGGGGGGRSAGVVRRSPAAATRMGTRRHTAQQQHARLERRRGVGGGPSCSVAGGAAGSVAGAAVAGAAEGDFITRALLARGDRGERQTATDKYGPPNQWPADRLQSYAFSIAQLPIRN